MEGRRRTRLDRRALLEGAVAAAGAALLGSQGVAAAAGHPPDPDSAALRSALAVELLTVFIYQHILARGVLGPQARSVAEQMLGHEQIHARTLAGELTRRGQTVPAPPAGVAQADRQLAARQSSGSLAVVHREVGALDLLYDIEAISIGTYYNALAKLTDPRLMRLATEIMGAEAQHASAIGGLLHPGKWERVVPVDSVRGKQ